MKFKGYFELNRKLTPTLHEFLNKLNQTRRISRICDNEIYGCQGEFYVDEDGAEILNIHQPPITQPSFSCCWKPTEDGMGIEWDRTFSCTHYVEWLNYLINKILIPNRYSITGNVEWQDQVSGEIGQLCVEDNFIVVETFGKLDYAPTCGLDMRLDYVYKDKQPVPKLNKTQKAFVQVLENYLSTKLLKTILLEVEAKTKQ